MTFDMKLNPTPLIDTDERLNPYSAFKVGIDKQREVYKMANLESNYDSMAKALENIKIEIKDKAKKKNLHTKIIQVEKILNWYNTLELIYTNKNSDGEYVLNLPANTKYKCSKFLNMAYEIILEILGVLDLV